MKNLLVVSVEPFTPSDESATVTLRSDQATIEVFCHPCDLKVGDYIENMLYALDANVCAAFLSDWPDDEKNARAIHRLEKIGPYAYRGCGHTLDANEGLIEVLGFRMQVGQIPLEGPVEFEISRIDVQ